MKKQYGILQALRVAMHPDKTFIGKVKKGFDFLGFHLTPTGVTVSEAALSRHEDKVARLYEQNAKPKRIRAYRLRWLVWATVALSPLAYADMTVGLNCPAGNPDTTAPFDYGEIDPFGTSNTASLSDTGSLPNGVGGGVVMCLLSEGMYNALAQPLENFSCPVAFG